MTRARPDDGIRHFEFDHDTSLKHEPRRVSPPAAVSYDHFADEPRARVRPGARHEHSGSRWHPAPVEVPDVVE